MLEESQLRAFIGRHVADRRGRLIGSVELIFDDRRSGTPEWIGVLTGLLRRQHVLVPVAGVERDRGRLRVPWPKETVRRAPTYGKHERGGILGLGEYRVAISEEKERAASAHYGLAPDA
jgi:hypothetical protein